MRTVLKGNSAVAHAVRMARAQVISAYPITPQTTIVEELADMVAKEELDARFIKVESEHSAMAGCIAAASAGARTFTATSSHGLVLMHEMLHWAAGARLPIVMVNVNRALGTPWNIWVGPNRLAVAARHRDGCRSTASRPKRCLTRSSRRLKCRNRCLLPTMVLLDAFYLSHTYEDIDLPEQSCRGRFPQSARNTAQNRSEPSRHRSARSPTPASTWSFAARSSRRTSRPWWTWEEVGRAWGDLTGRHYGLVEEYRNDDARGGAGRVQHAGVDGTRWQSTNCAPAAFAPGCCDCASFVHFRRMP